MFLPDSLRFLLPRTLLPFAFVNPRDLTVPWPATRFRILPDVTEGGNPSKRLSSSSGHSTTSYIRGIQNPAGGRSTFRSRGSTTTNGKRVLSKRNPTESGGNIPREAGLLAGRNQARFPSRQILLAPKEWNKACPDCGIAKGIFYF